MVETEGDFDIEVNIDAETVLGLEASEDVLGEGVIGADGTKGSDQEAGTTVGSTAGLAAGLAIGLEGHRDSSERYDQSHCK